MVVDEETGGDGSKPKICAIEWPTHGYTACSGLEISTGATDAGSSTTSHTGTAATATTKTGGWRWPTILACYQCSATSSRERSSEWYDGRTTTRVDIRCTSTSNEYAPGLHS